MSSLVILAADKQTDRQTPVKPIPCDCRERG